MGKLRELIKKGARLNADTVLFKVLSDPAIRSAAVKFIRDDQLFRRGVNADDVIIGRYSIATEKITGGLKKAGDPFNFTDTGVFRRSIRADAVKGVGLVTSADTVKRATDFRDRGLTVDLLDKYGENIIELTTENTQDLGQAFILAKLQNQIRRELGIQPV
ncbi:hypothetical protein LCGC14_0370680 [marine sediment metagenome]|uniref:Uncharacterized protein n=1 Tax=marine sediment metagenome TaxID=412755 RepID=A0A0F9TN77_9ZZZZ|nr:hypothetical protein [Maribacter sp.]HDZ04832.1 hypothetical protein [Maribacter sp.]